MSFYERLVGTRLGRRNPPDDAAHVDSSSLRDAVHERMGVIYALHKA